VTTRDASLMGGWKPSPLMVRILSAFVILAVVIGLVPTKGLPLPFLSYGGTALVMAMAALGTLLALARRPAVR